MLHLFRHQLLFVALTLSPLLFAGCGQNSVENKIIGTWEMSAYFTHQDIAKIAEEPMPDGVEMEMTLKGTQRYHRGGKYDGEGTLTMRFRMADGEISFRFYLKDAGEWELHSGGKEIVETTVDATLTPLDEPSKTFLEESPEFSASMTPIKGETSTTTILSLSDSIMEIEDDSITLTLKRL